MSRSTQLVPGSAGAALPPLNAPFLAHGLLPSDVHSAPPGPRRWWAGPLDVEGLALAAVQLCVQALECCGAGAHRLTAPAHRVAQAFKSFGLLRVDSQPIPGFAPHSGFFRCAEGWIRTHANYPHHEQALLRGLGLGADGNVEQSLRELTALEAEQKIVNAGGVAATVRTCNEWNTKIERGSPSTPDWVEFDMASGGPTRSWQPGPTADAPLRGLRVLDFTRVLAGPTAARTLAVFGASVLRIDPPQLPEIIGQHIETGFGKRSATVDAGSRAGRRQLEDLLTKADAVLLGYRPGALERHGLSVQGLRERFPHLVLVTLDAWGDANPWFGRRGFDSIVQAATGIAELYRAPDGAPGALPVQALDYATGYGMAASAIALLTERTRSGQCGVAHFALARTARELIDAPVPQVKAERLPDAPLRSMPSPYGTLTYVPPPFNRRHRTVDYPGPPPAYGADEPVWDTREPSEV